MVARTPGSRSDRGPPATEGGTARKNSTREAMAMRRRDELTKKIMEEENLSEADAKARALKTMRDNGRGDWRAG